MRRSDLPSEPVVFEEWAGIPFARYDKDTHDVARGTILFLNPATGEVTRTVPGFPHVPRTYQLARGIEALFGKSRFFAEEKIDGYNIRLAYHRGTVPAFTRGGFVCPLTSEWAEIWWDRDGLGAFFRNHPDHVLCGEVVGDNPYNIQRDPSIPAGLHLRIFDIREPGGESLPVEERYELIDRYELPTVPRIGTYNIAQLDELYESLRSLNEEGREGVVLKHENGREHLKFATPESELSDIRDNVPIAFDVGHAYFTNRVFRALLFVEELGLDHDHYAARLGEAFMNGFRRVETDPQADQQYVIYVRRWETWEALAARIGSAVPLQDVDVEDTELEGTTMRRITFHRHFKKSSRRFEEMLSGKAHID
jgi:putative ATP-dependent DNA ligase